jgi:dTDP-4-amino-4,6-dideoxygalactose transaminase
MKKINMAAPHFDEEDRKRIHREIDAILDGSLSMGPNVQAFEKEFAERVGVRHAVAMNSCTSALEAASGRDLHRHRDGGSPDWGDACFCGDIVIDAVP